MSSVCSRTRPWCRSRAEACKRSPPDRRLATTSRWCQWERDGATFDIQGRPVALALGHARTQTRSSAPDSVMVPADGRGHFVTDGQVNRLPIRFAVDTGATFVTLSARDASRLGLAYGKGGQGLMET